MFSTRLPAELSPNAVSRKVEALRQSHVTLIDLTETNPTTVGIPYPADVLAPLADRRAEHYAPDPRGLPEAREAIAAEYAATLPVSADHIVLTSSTSEGYAMLFKLVCDPGQSVLVPQPSYPLFDLLTRLDNVRACPYTLDAHGGWTIDRSAIESAMTPGVRAVLVVSPNNPTGSMLRRRDRDWLAGFCAERDLAIISDEVFADYPLAPPSDASSFLGEQRALTFTLGGLSKSAGLPQVKLAWIIVSGPDALARAALERLDVIADTYLSVSTPVQVAVGRLLGAGREIRAAIASRVRSNLAVLERVVRASPTLTLHAPEGGWSAVVEVPATIGDEQLVLRAVEQAHVLAHPGYFFDFPEGAFVVVSLLPRPEVFRDGVTQLLHIVDGANA